MSTSRFRGHSRKECTVVVLTRDRPASLCRALSSVQAQSCPHTRVLVLVDGNAPAPETLRDLCAPLRVSVVTANERELKTWPTVARVAQLRNLAVSLVSTEYLAFLDDDNKWAPTHLASLTARLLDSGAVCAHSWRRLQYRDGSPAVLREFPWVPTPQERSSRFADVVRAGIMNANNPIVKDTVTARCNGRELGMVDMGCWLLPRSLLLKCPFATVYTSEDIAVCRGEDDKLLDCIRANRIPTACTSRATLLYTLGGFSNYGSEIRE